MLKTGLVMVNCFWHLLRTKQQTEYFTCNEINSWNFGGSIWSCCQPAL